MKEAHLAHETEQRDINEDKQTKKHPGYVYTGSPHPTLVASAHVASSKTLIGSQRKPCNTSWFDWKDGEDKFGSRNFFARRRTWRELDGCFQVKNEQRLHRVWSLLATPSSDAAGPAWSSDDVPGDLCPALCPHTHSGRRVEFSCNSGIGHTVCSS